MGCWLSKGSPADTAMPQDEAMPERMAKAEAAAKEKKKRDEHGDAEAAAISLELESMDDYVRNKTYDNYQVSIFYF